MKWGGAPADAGFLTPPSWNATWRVHVVFASHLVDQGSGSLRSCLMKLANIPGTVRFLVQCGRLLVNWPAVTKERLHLKPYPDRLVFRNGVVLRGPNLGDLKSGFGEVWTEQAYSPAGYEIKRG